MTGQKLGFPDSGTCDWPVEIIDTIELMQNVLENSCQSCKKKWQFFGKIYVQGNFTHIWYMVHPGITVFVSFFDLVDVGANVWPPHYPFLLSTSAFHPKNVVFSSGLFIFWTELRTEVPAGRTKFEEKKISSILFSKFVHQKVAEHSKFRKLHI